MIIEVKDSEFQKEVIEKSKTVPVLVDFWASWCQPCLMLGPVLEKLVEQYQGKFVLVKYNVEENSMIASQFNISSIPSVILFKDGKAVDQFMGAIPENEIKQFLEQIEPTETDLNIKKGDEYYDSGRFEEAIKEYKNALEKDLKNDLLQYKIGNSYFKLQNFVEARKYLKPIEHIEQAKRVLNIIYFKEISQEDIKGLKEKVIQDPSNIENSLKLADQYAKIGDYEKGLNGYLNVLTMNKKYKDEIARKSMLRIFDVLGHENPVTKKYQRELANVLF